MAIWLQRDDGTYHLSQIRLFGMLQSVWDHLDIDITPTPNYMLQWFAIVMTLLIFIPHFQRLREGVTDTGHLDSAKLLQKQKIIGICLAFNNWEVVVILPDTVHDLEHIQLLDPNDECQLSIDRDRKSLYLCMSTFLNFQVILCSSLLNYLLCYLPHIYGPNICDTILVPYKTVLD